MKGLFLLTLLIGWLNTNAQEFSFNHGGYERKYLVHLPSGFSDQNSYPLVLAFHGGLGRGNQMENQSLLSDKADEEGFIVVYPDGVPFGALNIRTWNAGHCCGQAQINNVDDVGFVETLIDSLKSNYNIEEAKVYGTGMSNGAFLCYRIACEKPYLFAAIAPVAGTMAIDECESAKMVPIIHFQSKLDDNIPYQGGVGNGLSDQHNPPLDSVHSVWRTKGNCEEAIATIPSGYNYYKYSGCDCDNSIEYYLTNDGGHSWPGGTKSVGDDPSTSINANDLMWEFFQKFPKSCSTSIVEQSSSKEVLIWPNPSSDIIQFKTEGLKEIFDLTGQIVIKTNQNVLDIHSLNTGVYFVKFESNPVAIRFIKK